MRNQEEIEAMLEKVKRHDLEHSSALLIEVSLKWTLNHTAETPVSLLEAKKIEGSEDNIELLEKAVLWWEGMSDEDVAELDELTPWNLNQIKRLVYYANKYLQQKRQQS